MSFSILLRRMIIPMLLVFLLASGVMAQSTAAVTGIVFDDTNGNGQQDEGESGIANAVIVAIEEDTGAPITATTDADGTYRIEAEVINHRVRVDESSLPFSGELTTARLEYNLNVPPGFTAPNINFGYQEVEPAAAYGLVFRDDNGNGTQDEGESGLSGVTIVAVHDETGAVTTLTTDANGEYQFEATGSINHRLSVDVTTLPFTAQLTTGRDAYNLNVPPSYFAVNINFGYQEIQPAAAYGLVFRDDNGNGTQDEGESGLSGVTINVVHDETGALTTLTTDANGEYQFESDGAINHRLSVDVTTLLFTAQLTTGREEYNLNVPPEYFTVNINFGYQEVEPASVLGVVFNDANGNGIQDEGESGLSGVTILVVHDETGVLTTLTTDANGEYQFEVSGAINHRLSVDVSTLPFTGQLTTGREAYNLNVPAGYFAPNVNFGYQEAQPSVVTGTVFDDLNENGQQDENEKGIPNAVLNITHRADGDTTSVTTNADGTYRYETMERRFDLSVDEASLPYADPILTTNRETYRLNIPNGFVAPNVNFGYRAAKPEDYPPIGGGSSGGGDTGGGGEDPGDPADDGLTNPFEDPDPDMPIPDDLPEDAGEYAMPLEGTWTAYNGALAFNCGGMSFDQPPAPPETVTIRLEDGGQTLVGEGFEGDTVAMTASGTVRGLYTGTISISEQGATITMDFFIQVITPEYIIGYLTGEASAQGMTCTAYRPFEAEYAGN